MTDDTVHGDNGGHTSKTPFTDDEFETFVSEAVREDWDASRDADALHDISIVHEEKNREILIDSARNRISYRNTTSEEWGLQQKPVSDLSGAVVKLMTAGVTIPMNEMHYLGFDGHPENPNRDSKEEQ